MRPVFQRESGAMMGVIHGLSYHSVNFARLDLTNRYFAKADFRGIDFSQADLSGTDLSMADLSLAAMRGATLFGTNLDGARVDGTSFEGALFDEETVWPAGFDPIAAGARRSARNSPSASQV